MMARMLTALVLLGTLGSAGAQDERERFQLYTNCQPLRLFEFVQQSDGDELEGLTESVVRNVVESRLRSARLYTDEGTRPMLNVFVHIAGRAFHVKLYLEKYFYDFASDETSYATTWDGGSTGMHGTDASYVLSFVSRHMDQFLVEYLRVNEEACASQ